jgi:hypothetical protein
MGWTLDLPYLNVDRRHQPPRLSCFSSCLSHLHTTPLFHFANGVRSPEDSEYGGEGTQFWLSFLRISQLLKIQATPPPSRTQYNVQLDTRGLVKNPRCRLFLSGTDYACNFLVSETLSGFVKFWAFPTTSMRASSLDLGWG